MPSRWIDRDGNFISRITNTKYQTATRATRKTTHTGPGDFRFNLFFEKVFVILAKYGYLADDDDSPEKNTTRPPIASLGLSLLCASECQPAV